MSNSACPVTVSVMVLAPLCLTALTSSSAAQ